ncbi:MAG: acyloxyacyl hydrolase [Bacteroidota bacterium]
MHYNRLLKGAFFIVLVFCFCVSQSQDKKNTTFFIPELLIGKTLEANTDFPKTNLQTAFLFSIGNDNSNKEDEWLYRLGQPETGLTFGVIDFGNVEKIGRAYSLMPFSEFGLLKKKTSRLKLHIGLGASYMDTQFDSISNPFNRAITTKINWSFRSFVYYDLYKLKSVDFRFGLGYFHHSNGHTRLPNQGLNSILASFSAKFKSSNNEEKSKIAKKYDRSAQTYFDFRTGIGQNVLSEVFNDKKEVYSVAISAGRIINKTFKFGFGFHYRFYEHYYDYIKNNEALVAEQEPNWTNNPYRYATNYGCFFSSELLMGHVGFEFEIGINFYKPFYKFDWQLNQGYSFERSTGETVVVLGELDDYYRLKRTVPARMGLKYYLISNEKSPTHNLYIGAHINANLGQADFTELSLGYNYRFKKKNRRDI